MAHFYLGNIEFHVSNKILHAKSTKKDWMVLVNGNRDSVEVRKVKISRT